MSWVFREVDSWADDTSGSRGIAIGANINWLGLSLIAQDGGSHPSGVTWNGVAMANGVSCGSTGYRTSVWSLYKPAINSTYTLAWSGTSSNPVAGFLMSFETSSARGVTTFDANCNAHSGNDFLQSDVNQHPTEANVAISSARRDGSGGTWTFVEDGNSYRAGGNQNGGAYEFSSDDPETIRFGGESDVGMSVCSVSYFESFPVGVSSPINLMGMWNDFYDELKRGLIPAPELQKKYRELFI